MNGCGTGITGKLTVLVVLCLAGVCLLSGYEPPLKEVMPWKKDNYTVFFKVFDPGLNGWQEGSQTCLHAVNELTHREGIITWLCGSNKVFYCVYDPTRGAWQKLSQNNIGKVSRLEVHGGVVSYVVGGHTVHFSTYDPQKGEWKASSKSHDRTVLKLVSTGGAVAWKSDGKAVSFTIYDPVAGEWKTGSDFNSEKVSNLSISKGTVSWLLETQGQVIRGYNHRDHAWGESPTLPSALVYVYVDTSVSPLFVWLTDMSIGATRWETDLGDETVRFERSLYYKYKEMDAYTIKRTVSGPGGEDTMTAHVGSERSQ